MARYFIFLAFVFVLFTQSLSEEEDQEKSKTRAEKLMKGINQDDDEHIDIGELGDFISRFNEAVSQDDSNKIFDEYDVDIDGHVTWYEIEQYISEKEHEKMEKWVAEKRFQAADMNNDDKLDKYEFWFYSDPRHHTSMWDVEAEIALTLSDSDGDGQVSFQEFFNEHDHPGKDTEGLKRLYQEDFEASDTNEDNFLDQDELKNSLVKPIKRNHQRQSEQAMQLLDTNEDGLVNFEEFQANLEKMEKEHAEL